VCQPCAERQAQRIARAASGGPPADGDLQAELRRVTEASLVPCPVCNQPTQWPWRSIGPYSRRAERAASGPPEQLRLADVRLELVAPAAATTSGSGSDGAVYCGRLREYTTRRGPTDPAAAGPARLERAARLPEAEARFCRDFLRRAGLPSDSESVGWFAAAAGMVADTLVLWASAPHAAALALLARGVPMPTAAQLEDEADRLTHALEALVERPGLAPLAVALGNIYTEYDGHWSEYWTERGYGAALDGAGVR